MTGILFTIFIAWCIAVLSIFQFVVYLKIKKTILQDWRTLIWIFSLFWFLMSIVWILVGINDLFGSLGYTKSTFYTQMALQAIIGLDLLLVWRYLIMRFFSKRAGIFIFAFFILAVIGYETTLMIFKVIEKPATFFSSQHVLNSYTQIFFAILFLPALTLGVIDLVRSFLASHRNDLGKKFIVMASLSLIMIGIGGAFEQFEIVAEWRIQLARLVTLLGAMFAYLAVSNAPQVIKESGDLTV
ncbi:hypothetical protein ACFL3E_00180 [Patescibacteria group bacterium]